MSFVNTLMNEANNRNFDIVTGSRFRKKVSMEQLSSLKKLGIQTISAVINLKTGSKNFYPASEFRLIRSPLLK